MKAFRWALIAIGLFIFFVAGFHVYPGWESRIVGLVFIAVGVFIPYVRPSRAKGPTALLFLPQDTLIGGDTMQADTATLVSVAMSGLKDEGQAIWVAWVALLLGLGVIYYLRRQGHPAIIDRPDPPGSPKRSLQDRHTKYHVLGAGIVALGVSFAAGFFPGLLVSMVLWAGVEIAQRFPRDKLGGVFSWPDIFWNYVGAFLGAWVGGLLGTFV